MSFHFYKSSKTIVEQYTWDIFGDLLAAYQYKDRLTDEQFANILGISSKMLRKYKAKDSLPRLHTFLKISSRLGVEFLLEAIKPTGFSGNVLIQEVIEPVQPKIKKRQGL